MIISSDDDSNSTAPLSGQRLQVPRLAYRHEIVEVSLILLIFVLMTDKHIAVVGK